MRVFLLFLIVAAMLVPSVGDAACIDCAMIEDPYACYLCCLDAYEDCKEAGGGTWCAVEWARCSQRCPPFPQ